MDTSVQTIINKFLDEHYSEFLDRLATKIQEASTLPLVDYDALRHQAVLMQYVWEGVHQVQAVTPDSYLDQALALVTAAVNRANAATAAAEAINSQISAAEAQRVLAETARANAEDARAAAELLRVAAEQARVQAENTRGTNETDRQTQETARQTAESQRSSWFATFRQTVEAWYSDPEGGTGIVQLWNAFKADADSWISLAKGAWSSFFGATAESEGGVRKIWSTWFSGAQSDYQALNTTMNANEQARQTAEGLRADAEDSREDAEALRQQTEDNREDAELLRQQQEQTRQQQEQQRQTDEGTRRVQESGRETAEDDREDAEAARAAAEQTRQANYSQLLQNVQALYQQMLTRANHPAQFGADGYIYEYDLQTEQYVKTEHFWQKFDRFRISKEFASIAQMKAYDPDNLPEGESPLETFAFVLIKSTPADPDNSKLFSYMGEDAEPDPDYGQFHYLGDFSGAMGFEGKTPQFSIGTVTAGNPGTQPQVTMSANGTDANGNPRFLLNFAIPTAQDINTHRPIQVNGSEILGNNTTALNLKAGTNVSLSGSGNTVTIAATDTNTWRPLGTGSNDACAGNDSRLSNARPASDVYSWAKASSKPSYSYSEISGIQVLSGNMTTVSYTNPDGATRYASYVSMTEAEARKVISFQYMVTNQGGGFDGNNGCIFFSKNGWGYSRNYTEGSLTLKNTWFHLWGAGNPGTVTYKILKLA